MINIDAISSLVPQKKVDVQIYNKKFGKDYVKKISEYSGYKNLYILDKKQKSYELALNVSKNLISQLKLKIKDIDCLLYVSHTRDKEMPPTSSMLQRDLNLNQNIFCYDLPMSCSGFAYSLIHANMIIKSGIAKKILIICGDALSKYISSKNKNLRLLIGDSYSALLVSKNNSNKMIFNYGVNGDLNDALSINYEKELLTKKLEMDGLTIMSFAMNEVSNSIGKFIIKNKINLKKSYFCLHQPNKTIHNYLLQKFKIDKRNSISTYKYGNTSAGMIPLSLNEYFRNNKMVYNRFLISGFGSGFLWANIFINIKNTKFLGVKKL